MGVGGWMWYYLLAVLSIACQVIPEQMESSPCCSPSDAALVSLGGQKVPLEFFEVPLWRCFSASL